VRTHYENRPASARYSVRSMHRLNKKLVCFARTAGIGFRSSAIRQTAQYSAAPA
jgi:hypothetical protein